jgi:hypothetical protein
MECKSYTPCTDCRIVKTYSTIELDKEKRIYENDEYNYTGICDLIDSERADCCPKNKIKRRK